jgi:Response regulator containing CheY-like receiver, AAA-type ATPase, and DNA-binding domains
MQEYTAADFHAMDTTKSSILVVEDDVAIAQIIVLTIDEETSFAARFVATPQEALAVVDRQRPVLLLIDYQLPEMNGLQLYDTIIARKHLPHIPAIMMSANLPWNELRKRQLVGLEKPFDLDELLDLIAEVVR